MFVAPWSAVMHRRGSSEILFSHKWPPSLSVPAPDSVFRRAFTWRKEACEIHNFLPLRYSSTCRRSALMATRPLTLKRVFFPIRSVAPPSSRSLELFEPAAFRSFGCICNEKMRGNVNLKRVVTGRLTDLKVRFTKSPLPSCFLRVSKDLKLTHSSLGGGIWLIWTESKSVARVISCLATVLVLASTGLSSLQPLKEGHAR